ncbi:hypothetical protein WK62_05295 [Burkholderia ubonensis]|nr:hypothetical protein WK62_05295 [Burkholderia ubonensis]
MSELPNPLTDVEREKLIGDLACLMIAETDAAQRLRIWRGLRELILGRSQSQIARMERLKGLQ